MKMEYKLLDNGTGVLLTRQPEVVSDKLYISFDGAPNNATAIFDVAGKNAIYRELSDGMCELPYEQRGVIKVCVAILDGHSKKKWVCDEITANKTQGGVLYAPNDMNLQLIIVGLRLENQELREQCSELRKDFEDLTEKYERLTEGYNLT